jgi:hypothetical protein
MKVLFSCYSLFTFDVMSEISYDFRNGHYHFAANLQKSSSQKLDFVRNILRKHLIVRNVSG